MSMYIGEALSGEGNEIAHIDLLIGDKDGPVGQAFANALARQSEGHTNLLAVLTPNLLAKPATADPGGSRDALRRKRRRVKPEPDFPASGLFDQQWNIRMSHSNRDGKRPPVIPPFRPQRQMSAAPRTSSISIRRLSFRRAMQISCPTWDKESAGRPGGAGLPGGMCFGLFWEMGWRDSELVQE